MTRKPVTVSEAERQLRVRSMLPVRLDYDPFENPDAMKRLLSDLANLILAGKLHHRAASAVRLLVAGWIEVDEHQRLDAIEKRVEELEKAKQG